jgi:DNA-directed RNA polymerase subunit K/omega
MEDLIFNLPQEKETVPYMTIFEKSKIIEGRVKQIDDGYKSTIEDIVEKEGLTRSVEIALREFELGKLPGYELKKTWGDGSYEIWKHEDFEPRLEDIDHEKAGKEKMKIKKGSQGLKIDGKKNKKTLS